MVSILKMMGTDNKLLERTNGSKCSQDSSATAGENTGPQEEKNLRHQKQLSRSK